jgi:16S rRNA (cytidine1402-2'-O)-methyltransferase
MPGTLFVVATPIGNLEDVTARALRILRDVALIAAEDTRRTAHLLARYAITTKTTSLHEHNEARKTPSLVARLVAGDDIALVSDAGTPLISDPGRHLVRAAIDAGITIEPIPGPSAVMAALSASGLNTDAFAFLGFPPIRASARKDWFDRFRAIGGLVVFFEAPHRIKSTLDQLLHQIGDRPIVLCRELTKTHEELVRGPISVVLDRLCAPKGEFVVIVDVGQSTDTVPAKHLGDMDLYTEFGRITNSGHLSRRRAIAALAQKYGRAPNDIYEAVERGKKSAG